MWGTPTKQETSDILGKMSFGIIVRSTLSALIWYQNQVHYYLLLFEIWPFVYKTVGGSSVRVILRNGPLNSGRLYRGHVSDSLGYQLIWCRMIHWAFWHLFLLKSARKWDSAAPKTKSGTGGLWGSKNDNLGQIFYFTWYFIDFSAVMYLFEVKESTLKSFIKIRPSMLKKMADLRQIKARGALLLPRPHSHIFLCFLMSGVR